MICGEFAHHMLYELFTILITASLDDRVRYFVAHDFLNFEDGS